MLPFVQHYVKDCKASHYRTYLFYFKTEKAKCLSKSSMTFGERLLPHLECHMLMECFHGNHNINVNKKNTEHISVLFDHSQGDSMVRWLSRFQQPGFDSHCWQGNKIGSWHQHPDSIDFSNESFNSELVHCTIASYGINVGEYVGLLDVLGKLYECQYQRVYIPHLFCKSYRGPADLLFRFRFRITVHHLTNCENH